ncbi:MAG: ABC transporter permease, partial [Alphaproteobacteria bacterium]|nr:ABC transporter permease [Alphaproteobacteria bacterium]
MSIPILADQSTRGLLTRLVANHVRPHWGRVALSILCMALAAAATAANAWLMEPVLDKVFVARDTNMLYLIPLAVILAALIKGVATYFQGVL